MSRVKSILNVDNTQLPEDLQDAQALAGLISQVQNESIAMCRSVNPDDVPGGADSELAARTGGLGDIMSELKSRKYKVGAQRPQTQQPQSAPLPPPPSAQQNTVTLSKEGYERLLNPVSATVKRDDSILGNFNQSELDLSSQQTDDQLELNLNPSTAEQIVNLLDKIESHLSKLCNYAKAISEKPTRKTRAGGTYGE